jgi:hypothetical protein
MNHVHTSPWFRDRLAPDDWDTLRELQEAGAIVVGVAGSKRGPFTVRITRNGRSRAGCGTSAQEAIRRAVAADRETT